MPAKRLHKNKIRRCNLAIVTLSLILAEVINILHRI